MNKSVTLMLSLSLMLGILGIISQVEAKSKSRTLASLHQGKTQTHYPTLLWNPKGNALGQQQNALQNANPQARWDLLPGTLQIENQALMTPWAPPVRNFMEPQKNY